MKIHLIRSKDVSNDLYEGLESLLVEKGPMTFHFDDKFTVDFGDADVLSWKEIFRECSNYRDSKSIPKMELVVIVTNKKNDQNWFSAMDFDNPINGFVHSGEWDLFLDTEPQHPVAFQVVALVLHKFLVYDEGESVLYERTHEEPRGCISDMCSDKKQVTLQTRAADICPDCLQILVTKVSSNVITQAFRLIDSIRGKMLFITRYLKDLPLNRLLVSRRGTLRLEGVEIELKLSPQEKTLYIFLLLHGQPIGLGTLDDHYTTLLGIYKIVTDNFSGIDDPETRLAKALQQHETIMNMLNIATGTAQQVVAKIRKKVMTTVGPFYYDYYKISDGENYTKYIAIDPRQVEI